MKRLLPYLRQNGVDTRIIFFAAHTNQLPAYNYFSQLGFECKLIYWELFNEEKITEILNDVRANPPDVFIPNYFPVALYAARWIKQSGIPTVCILHNDDAFHLKLVELFAMGKEVDKVSAMVGVSQLLTGIIQKQNPDIIIKCLPYGAPVPSQTAVLTPNETLKIIYVGRIMETQKKISEVTKAFCRVAKEIQGTECVLYGSGKDLKKVLSILQSEGKGLPVRYGGSLETGKVQQHMLQNHIFVLLSEYEGLPIALMEAMACGLVPVCLDSRSGMKELILENETGLLVSDRGNDFVNVVKRLKNDPALWHALSIAARKKIVEEYSEESCNKRWLHFLKELAGNGENRKPIELPAMSALRSLYYPQEFALAGKPMPSALLLPLYKLKHWAGRMKRSLLTNNIFNNP